MRIVKEWSVADKKYTLFQYNLKYTLKIEDHLVEQTFKLGDSTELEINRLTDLVGSDHWQKIIMNNFKVLHKSHQELFADLLAEDIDDNEFDIII